MPVKHRDDFVSCLRAELVQSLGRLPADATPQRAQAAAQAVVRRVTLKYRGERVYIRDERYDPEAVVRDFNFANHAEVCQKHGISRATLKRLMQRQRIGRVAAPKEKKPGSVLP